MIKPALTAEEWGRALLASSRLGALALTVGNRDDLAKPGTPECVAAFDHAKAALCLHEQPFGFTHEDVEFLRRVVILAASIAPGHEAYWSKAHNLASRIEALLAPPNAKEGT